MLTAVQGIIKNDVVVIDRDTLRQFNGRTVTVIINEDLNSSGSKQDKSKFFDAVGKIKLDRNAVDELRAESMI